MQSPVAIMTTVSVSSTSTNAPWHLWVVGIVSLLWNCFGAFDYLMTQLGNEAYLSQLTTEQVEYFSAFPIWAVAAWAVAVWASVAGSLGLLFRKAWAEWAFALSLVGLVGSSIYTLVLSDGLAVMGGAANLVFTIVIWIIAIGLFIYARTQANRGVLK